MDDRQNSFYQQTNANNYMKDSSFRQQQLTLVQFPFIIMIRQAKTACCLVVLHKGNPGLMYLSLTRITENQTSYLSYPITCCGNSVYISLTLKCIYLCFTILICYETIDFSQSTYKYWPKKMNRYKAFQNWGYFDQYFLYCLLLPMG
jgi:hypothetical protein